MAAPAIQDRIRTLSRFLPDEGVAAALGITLADVKAVAMLPGTDVEEPSPGIPSWVAQRFEETNAGPFSAANHVIAHGLATPTPLVFMSTPDGVWMPAYNVTDDNTVTIIENVSVDSGDSISFVVIG